MITADQIKAARRLLGWSSATLGQKARRSALTIAKAETSTLHPQFVVGTLRVIRATLEAAGVEFTNGEQGGVRLRDATTADLRVGSLDREADAMNERDGKKGDD